MANHITRLILDNSAFDPQLGKSIKLVNSLYSNIDALCKGMIGLDGPQKQMIAGLGKLQYDAETAAVMVGKLEKMFQGLKQTYNGMDIHTKMTAFGKNTSSMMMEFSRQIKAIKAQIDSIPNTTTKKIYIQPTTSVSGGESSASAAASAAASAGGKGIGAFGAIFGGNLAARAVMDSLRMLKRATEDAIQTNMDFEYSQATLSAVLGKSKEEIIDLTEQARKLGSTSLYSAKEISELQIVLARLGFNKQEIEDSTDAIAKLALATGVDLEKAATLTGSTLRAFGYSTKEAARVASVLGVSTTKSALDMQKLATAMGYASSVSRQAGFEIEEVVAMLGKMVDNGQQATTAGVNVRNIMLDLSNKSSKLSKAIKQVTGKDQVRGFDEFVDALRQMRDAGMNLDDVANVVQKRVTPGFLNMVANTEGISQLRDELKGCTGELTVMADKMENTLQGATTKFSNAWNGLMLSFNNSKGIMRDVVVGLTEILNKWAELNNRNFGTQSSAISSYEKGISDSQRTELDNRIASALAGGASEDAIRSGAEKRIATLEKEKADLQKAWDDFQAALNGDWKTKADSRKALEKALGFSLQGKNEAQAFYQAMANRNDKIAQQQYYIGKLPSSIVSGNGSADISGNTGIGLGNTEKTAAQTAAERVADALRKYERTITLSNEEFKTEVKTGEQTLRTRISAAEQVYAAFAEAYADTKDEKYLTAMREWLEKVRETSARLGDLSNELEKIKQNAKEQNKTDNYELRKQMQIDRSILWGLNSAAQKAGWNSEMFGTTGIMPRINMGVDISEEEWNKFADKLNAKLKELGLDQITIDFETGKVQKAEEKYRYIKGGIINPDEVSLMGSAEAITSSIGQIADSLETLGVTISEEFRERLDKVNAILSIIEAIGTLIGVIQGILVAMLVRKMIPFFHEGGMVHAANGYFVPGAYNGGRDTVPAMLSPGELVLNRAQQNNLAAQLSGNGYGAMNQHIRFEIEGTKLIGVTNNTIRARGGKNNNLIYQH